jgi:hypothetical protein
MVKTVAILAVSTMIFAACEPAEDDPTPDPGTERDANFVAFTFEGIDGAAVIDKDERTVSAQAKETVDLSDITAGFTLSTGATATVDGTPQVSGATANDFNDPVTYTVTSGDGETTLDWTVTIIKPLPVGKKYITYNKPVDAYYIEYSGGIIDANLPEKNTNITGLNTYNAFAIAYENRKYSEVHSPYGDEWAIWHRRADGTSISSWYGDTKWFGGDAEINDPSDPNAVEWREEPIRPQYPLDDFGKWVTKYKDGSDRFMRYNAYSMAVNARSPEKYELPDNTDVTELYVRSEKVMDILCYVYQDTENVPSEGTRTWTFWVDPATGFTLKYEATDYDGTMESKYEVTKLVIGKPEWDAKHLHPLTTDTVEQ